MAKMRAMQVGEAGGEFELVEREIPEPGFGEALVRVHAGGVVTATRSPRRAACPG